MASWLRKAVIAARNLVSFCLVHSVVTFKQADVKLNLNDDLYVKFRI